MSEYDKKAHQSTQSAEDFDKIPNALKKLRQWVRWRLEDRKGKLTKIPLNPRTGRPASSTDPSTWGTYDEAIANRFGTGIGFVLTLEAEIAGIDLDHVIHDGVIEPWAEEIIREINSYTELSPSREGVHIFSFVNFPFKGRKKGQFECYGNGRYFTVTGNHLPGTPLIIEQRSEQFFSICDRIFGKQEQTADTQDSYKIRTDLSIEEIVKKASRAANGDKFARLWKGDWQGFYPSQSEGDAALCSILAFYLGPDPERIDQLFRNSGLMRPKWDEKHFGDGCTYGRMTITRILARNTTKESNSGDPSKIHALPPLNATDGNLDRITNAAWKALHASNHPLQFFRQGNLLVRVEKDSSGRPIFRELTLDRVVYHLGRAGHWYKKTEEGKKSQLGRQRVLQEISSQLRIRFCRLSNESLRLHSLRRTIRYKLFRATVPMQGFTTRRLTDSVFLKSRGIPVEMMSTMLYSFYRSSYWVISHSLMTQTKHTP
jgi:putative DNA primase/helicase